MGYYFRLARVLLYTPSARQDSTYHRFCYTSHGALAGMRNSSMGPPWRIDPMTHRTMSKHFYHRATSHSFFIKRLRAFAFLESLRESSLLLTVNVQSISTVKYVEVSKRFSGEIAHTCVQSHMAALLLQIISLPWHCFTLMFCSDMDMGCFNAPPGKSAVLFCYCLCVTMFHCFSLMLWT